MLSPGAFGLRATLEMARNIAVFRHFLDMKEQKSGRLPALGLALGVLLLLAVMAGELALSARRQSQTFDEAVHIFAGYRYWKNFDFGVNPEHPPLVKLIAALPLLRLPLRAPASIPDIDFKMAEYAAGRQFLYDNDAGRLLWRARMGAALFTIGLGLAVFFVAYAMFGAGPAFLALALVVFDPNVLAHGALVTTDVGATLGIFLGVGCFYLYLKHSSWPRLVAAGLAAGLCLGVKHSGILLVPMLVLLAAADGFVCDPAAGTIAPNWKNRLARNMGALAAIGAISLALLWSFYGFRYSARPPGLAVTPSLPEFAKSIGPVSSALILQVAHWHLLPEAYLFGVVDIGSKETVPTLIFGKFYPSARWFYFPAVFVIKSTLAFLILCCLIPLSKAVRERPIRRELLFLAVPVVIYLCAAMSSRINFGVRHLLPVYPFLILLGSYAAWNLGKQHRALAAAVAILAAFHAVSSLKAFPNYIPYANELWGGPAGSHEWLADSNVDWGQGLVAMKQYIDRHQIKNCWFGYFGALIADVSYYGIPCKTLPTAFSNLIQLPTPVVPPEVDEPVFLSVAEVAPIYWREEWLDPYRGFAQVRPSAVIAGSILVYDGKVDMSQVAALTHEDSAKRLMREHRFVQALGEAETAVQLAPDRPAAHMTRSTVLSAMGRNEEAFDEMQKAELIARGVLKSE